MRIIAAAGTDELEHAGESAFGAAVHDAGRLAPHECRPAVTGLTGKRECHTDHRPHTQPRVAAMVPTRRGGGGRTATTSGTGHGGRVTRTAHSTHRQACDSCAAGVWSSLFVTTRRYTQALRGEMSSRAGQCTAFRLDEGPHTRRATPSGRKRGHAAGGAASRGEGWC